MTVGQLCKDEIRRNFFKNIINDWYKRGIVMKVDKRKRKKNE